jgi:tripartite-type tricarboxylate transporter receptor subunit TctC
MTYCWGLSPDAESVAAYPDHPIKLVVGFAAGGNSDLVARVLASGLGESLKKPVFVENHSGAGGDIAAALVAKARADGYTLLLSSIGPLSVAPILVSDLPYNPSVDLDPISLVTSSDHVLVISPVVGARTLEEFLKLAREAPGAITVASTGIGTVSHLAIAMLARSAGVHLTHVPYRSVESLSGDLMTGRVSAAFAPTARVAQRCINGTLFALASTGTHRSIELPDTPTFGERGYPDVEIVDWYALMAPANTPRSLLDKLNNEVGKILQSPSTRSKLQPYGLVPIPSTRAELARHMQTEALRWSKLVAADARAPAVTTIK